MASQQPLHLPHGEPFYSPANHREELRARVPAGAQPAEWPVYMFWPERTPMRPPTGIATGIEAVVEVNHGRWIVRCPFCPGAQHACRSDPRFFCVDCLHVGTAAEGKFVAVVWPDAASAIEAELLVRPVAGSRNWSPQETVADLRVENEENGLIPPPGGGGGGRR